MFPARTYRLRLDSTSIGIDVDPYVVVLARRVRRARAILGRAPAGYQSSHRWAERVLIEARSYLHHRTIRLPQ